LFILRLGFDSCNKIAYLPAIATLETLGSMGQNATDQEKAAAYLVYEFERRAYPLSDAGFTIGRDAGSSIVVREPSVSRTHAEVRAEGGEFVLHTSGATGTRLNGRVVTTPRQLKDGDRIEIGTAELTFRRSKLPLGVSVVDRAEPHPGDDILSRRTTISNPILGGGHQPGNKRNVPLVLLVLMLILAVVAGYYFLMR
jgi:FHA domain